MKSAPFPKGAGAKETAMNVKSWEDAMKKNMGPVQRVIWVIAGIALLAWALFGSGDYKWIGWIGVVPLVTGIIGWCGINAVLGINTCKNC